VSGDAHRILLITPAHNEAAHLRETAESLLAQTRRPDLWVIVDDNSTDGTAEIADELGASLPFARAVHTPPRFTVDKGDRNAAGGPDRAFNFGLDQAEWKTFTHLGKLDGDIVLPPDYLEGMMERFAADPKLGIAGGADMEPALGGGWKVMPTPEDHATPQARLYSLECYEAIGGMPPYMGADVITTMYAKMRGYQARTFGELAYRHLRPMATADGVKRGRMRLGEYQYIVHYHPLWMVARSFIVAIRFRPYLLSGWWVLWGYVKAAFGSTEPVRDPELRSFIRAEQRERLRSVVGRLLPS
jgi:glycosyltransferase involved in cell wall biosynthesis